MDVFEDDCNSNGGENWIQSQKYTNWEMECIQRLETSPDLEQHLEVEKGGNAHKLWMSFQTAACNIAQLYQVREQSQSGQSWVQFQSAASAVTTLYKDCIESQKRFSEYGFQSGQQKRNKELLAWIKKRKRHIRREDLIAFLSGATTQASYGHQFHHHYHHHRNWSSPKQRLSISDSTGRSAFTRLSLSDGLTSDPNSQTNNTSNSDETDLETFREALALSGLRSSPQHSTSNSRKSSVIRVPNPSNNSIEELNAFINEEYNRHVVESRKRASDSGDVNMDSPTHKRSKLT